MCRLIELDLNVDALALYFSVYLTSMFKFLVGPPLGVALGLAAHEAALLTVLGMMTTVSIISLLGASFRRQLNGFFGRNRKVFTKRNRRLVKWWNKYGLAGVSFLTPVLLSPVIGALVVNALGGAKQKILLYMAVSAVFWALVITYMADFIKAVLLP